MATSTENFKFKKPDESDFYDVQDQNGNWDIADQELEKLNNPTFEDYTGDTSVPAASAAIEELRSKSKLGVLLSNIKAAFKGACLIGHIVNNCVTDRSDLPLSAAQGKALMDLYNVLNTKTKLSKGEVLNLRYIGATLLGSSSILYFTMYIKKFDTLPTVKLDGICSIQYENVVFTLDTSKITAVIIDSNETLGQIMISMDISSETSIKSIPVGVDISLTITGN